MELLKHTNPNSTYDYGIYLKLGQYYVPLAYSINNEVKRLMNVNFYKINNLSGKESSLTIYNGDFKVSIHKLRLIIIRLFNF